MTERSKIPLGDLLAAPRAEPVDPIDPWARLQMIAAAFDVDFVDLLADIQGKGPLAKIARAVTGIPLPGKLKPGPKTVRPANLQLVEYIDARRRTPESVEVAVREWLTEHEPERRTDRRRIAATKKRYNNTKSALRAIRDVRLADFFVSEVAET